MSDSDKEAVRNLSDEAAGDFDAQRYQQAGEKFARAYDVAKIPSLALWTARANEKLGKWVVAYEQYLQATSLERNELWRGDAQQKAQKDAEREMQKLLPRIPKLTIRIEGADPKDVRISIDGMAVPSGLVGVERLADPGAHQVTGQRGTQILRENTNLVEGGKADVVLRFSPPTPATVLTQTTPSPIPTAASPSNPGLDSNRAGAPADGQRPFGANGSAPEASMNSSASSQRTWGWVGVGVGAVGIAVGSVTGILVLSKYGSLKDKCNDRHCDASLQSEVDSYRTLRSVSVVGFVVGGVATAAGVTLLLTSKHKNSESGVGLVLGPGVAAVAGTF